MTFIYANASNAYIYLSGATLTSQEVHFNIRYPLDGDFINNIYIYYNETGINLRPQYHKSRGLFVSGIFAKSNNIEVTDRENRSF